MSNSQYERDFNDLGALKRPGRLDFRTLNNVDDAGDGYPGMQKAIRNYFHEGYLEKDINMNTHKIINLQAPSNNNDGARKIDVDTVQNDLDGFDDELKSLSAVEVQQLQNIDSVTISNIQWGYVGGADQPVKVADNVVFAQVTLNAGNLIVGTRQLTDGEWQQLTNINTKTITETQWGYLGSSNQGIATSNTPSFTGLTLTGNLALVANSITGTGVNIGNVELQQLSNIASATISGVQWGYLGGLDQSLAQAQTPTFVGLILSANLVTTSTVDGVDVSDFKTDYDTHKASTGVDHTYIDQSVIMTASPTFNGLTINGNIVVTGSVDGIDISTHATNNSAHHTKYTDANARASISNIIGSDGHLDGHLDADQHRIVDLADPISDNDAAIRSSLGEGKASTVVQHTNNAEKMTNSTPYIKLKEVIVYRNLKGVTIKWEMKSDPGNPVYAKVYVNGLAVGTEFNATSTTYIVKTEDFSNIYVGDLIQIYGRTWDTFTDLYIINMEIRYDFLFTNNDP